MVSVKSLTPLDEVVVESHLFAGGAYDFEVNSSVFLGVNSELVCLARADGRVSVHQLANLKNFQMVKLESACISMCVVPTQMAEGASSKYLIACGTQASKINIV